MFKWIATALLCAGLTAACGGGGGSGVSRSKTLVSLSDAEVTSLCEYFAEGEVRTVDCGSGPEDFGPEPVAECVASQNVPPGCTATVGDAEDCNEDLQAAIDDATDAELCSGEGTPLPASCVPLFACAFM